jgi:hypothetical protein
MKHIFFAFPAGLAGLALVLFRLSAALSIAAAAGKLPAQSFWQSSLLYLLSCGFVAGFPTRIISGFSALGAAICALTIGGFSISCSGAFILNMLALSLIGPGAYSIDAALFGRRTIHLPD